MCDRCRATRLPVTMEQAKASVSQELAEIRATVRGEPMPFTFRYPSFSWDPWLSSFLTMPPSLLGMAPVAAPKKRARKPATKKPARKGSKR